MASSIIPADSLARATAADLARAALYVRCVAWDGRMSDPDSMRMVFERQDGETESFTLASLRTTPWRRFGRPDDVLRIEYMMRPAQSWSEGFAEHPISYIARADRKAGGKLVPDTRLSDYFEGEAGYDAAQIVCSQLKAQWPDAGVFLAASVTDAERSLQGVDVHAENLERRKSEIRVEQVEARARLETTE